MKKKFIDWNYLIIEFSKNIDKFPPQILKKKYNLDTNTFSRLLLKIPTLKKLNNDFKKNLTHERAFRYTKYLIEEELNEFKEAISKKDLKEVADALTDILYVTYGAGHAFGINLDDCFEEVQKSNMSKLGDDGNPIYNENGKVMKGPKYFKPDLKKFLV